MTRTEKTAHVLETLRLAREVGFGETAHDMIASVVEQASEDALRALLVAIVERVPDEVLDLLVAEAKLEREIVEEYRRDGGRSMRDRVAAELACEP